MSSPSMVMMSSSNGDIPRVTGPLGWGSAAHQQISPTKASDTELRYFFDLHLNKRLSKQYRRRGYKTPSHSLWRHCNDIDYADTRVLAFQGQGFQRHAPLSRKNGKYTYVILFLNQFNKKRVNTLRSRQNGRPFADGIFKSIFLNENIWVSIDISKKFVLKGPFNNIPALVLIMARRRQGDKPLSEPRRVGSLTHICVTRPQWFNLRSRW